MKYQIRKKLWFERWLEFKDKILADMDIKLDVNAGFYSRLESSISTQQISWNLRSKGLWLGVKSVLN